jgi:hypothetical protein
LISQAHRRRTSLRGHYSYPAYRQPGVNPSKPFPDLTCHAKRPDLGEAENAHKAILSRILAGTGLTYHHYVTLTLTAASGGTADRDQLVSRLAAALKIEDAAVLAVIADLTSRGLFEDLPGEGPRVRLTDAGQVQFSD